MPSGRIPARLRIQQLQLQLDELSAAFGHLKVQNAELKFRQEVLEQLCRINHLALHVTQRVGHILCAEASAGLSRDHAAAAIGLAEQQIQQFLHKSSPFSPAAVAAVHLEQAEVHPPRLDGPSAAASVLDGNCLSTLQYGLLLLLKRPDDFIFIQPTSDPEEVLNVNTLYRVALREMLAAVEHLQSHAVAAPTTSPAAAMRATERNTETHVPARAQDMAAVADPFRQQHSRQGAAAVAGLVGAAGLASTQQQQPTRESCGAVTSDRPGATWQAGQQAAQQASCSSSSSSSSQQQQQQQQPWEPADAARSRGQPLAEQCTAAECQQPEAPPGLQVPAQQQQPPQQQMSERIACSAVYKYLKLHFSDLRSAQETMARCCLDCLAGFVCLNLVDPGIAYRSVVRSFELFGYPSKDHMQGVLDAVQLSAAQFEAIAATRRLHQDILLPLVQAGEEVQQQVVAALLQLQQGEQGVQQQQAGPAAGGTGHKDAATTTSPIDVTASQAQHQAAAAGPSSGTPMADGVAAGGPAVAASASQQPMPVSAAVQQPCRFEQLPLGTSSSTLMELYGLLQEGTQRLSTLHRTLGWLENAQDFITAGILTFDQLATLIVRLGPWPILIRRFAEFASLQYEVQVSQDPSAHAAAVAASAAAVAAGSTARMSSSGRRLRIIQKGMDGLVRHSGIKGGRSGTRLCFGYTRQQIQQQQAIAAAAAAAAGRQPPSLAGDVYYNCVDADEVSDKEGLAQQHKPQPQQQQQQQQQPQLQQQQTASGGLLLAAGHGAGPLRLQPHPPQPSAARSKRRADSFTARRSRLAGVNSTHKGVHPALRTGLRAAATGSAAPLSQGLTAPSAALAAAAAASTANAAAAATTAAAASANAAAAAAAQPQQVLPPYWSNTGQWFQQQHAMAAATAAAAASRQQPPLEGDMYYNCTGVGEARSLAHQDQPQPAQQHSRQQQQTAGGGLLLAAGQGAGPLRLLPSYPSAGSRLPADSSTAHSSFSGGSNSTRTDLHPALRIDLRVALTGVAAPPSHQLAAPSASAAAAAASSANAAAQPQQVAADGSFQGASGMLHLDCGFHHGFDASSCAATMPASSSHLSSATNLLAAGGMSAGLVAAGPGDTAQQLQQQATHQPSNSEDLLLQMMRAAEGARRVSGALPLQVQGPNLPAPAQVSGAAPAAVAGAPSAAPQPTGTAPALATAEAGTLHALLEQLIASALVPASPAAGARTMEQLLQVCQLVLDQPGGGPGSQDPATLELLDQLLDSLLQQELDALQHQPPGA